MTEPERLPPPAALLIFDGFVRALADGRGRPFLIRRGDGPVRRVEPGERLGPPVTVGWLSRHEAAAVLAEWTAAVPEGGR